ncbi:MAG: hypothetical protein JWP12_1542 [Bacteroidetes bacterium]|nr:hypothetical protein [Bacteroidota bacterium]
MIVRVLLSFLFLMCFCTSFSQEVKNTLPHLSIPDTKQHLQKEPVSDSLKDAYTAPDIHLPIDSSLYKNNISSLKSNLSDTLLKQKMNDRKGLLLGKKDSLLFSSSKLNTIKPASVTFLKKQLKDLSPHGSIAVGYDYGVLPFVSGGTFPAGGYKTEGNVSFMALNIPLKLMFHFTNVKNAIGINNYFRISYDADRYKEGLSQKLSTKEKLAKDQITKLQLQQQQTMQKMQYLDFMKQSPMNSFSSKQPLTGAGMPSVPSTRLNDPLPDSAAFSGKKPSMYNYTVDSAAYVADYTRRKDSVANEIKTYTARYDSLNTAIITLKKEVDSLNSLKERPQLNNPYLSKMENILSAVKKFEIGLCTPSYSTFLVNNIPLQGINMELEKNNHFFAFTYGTTINTLLYNTNTIQGKIQGVRNMYNYFDFGNLSSGRKIISLKGGIGAKEETHLYAGFLIAKGSTDYSHLSTVDHALLFSGKESNLVLELDAKYKFSQQLNVDFVLGKSSLKEEDVSMDQLKRSVNEIFSNYRSYAFLTKVNWDLKPTKTKFTFSVRWIDPYFKSFGLGFLRSDNLRYEVKAEQPITRKIKYTIAYKREEDNLLKLYDYKNVLQSINNTLSVKLNRYFNMRLIYAPLFRELKTSTYKLQDRNYISTAILSFIPKAKNVNAQFNVMYSKYIISGDSSKINFENLTYTHQLSFKSGFRTSLNVSWFKNNLVDTVGNDTYLSVLDVGYTAKNNSGFTLGGKAAYKKKLQPQFGFVVKATLKLYKGLYWEAEMERIIIGDYYDSFMIEKIKKFPYYCSSRLTINF